MNWVRPGSPKILSTYVHRIHEPHSENEATGRDPYQIERISIHTWITANIRVPVWGAVCAKNHWKWDV